MVDLIRSIAHQIVEKEIMNLPETHFAVLLKEEKMLNSLIELKDFLKYITVLHQQNG